MFKNLKPFETIATGITTNDPDGIFMADIDLHRELLWIAQRGYGNDWTIYVHWATNGLEFVKHNGDKVKSHHNIIKLVPCTPDVLALYRF